MRATGGNNGGQADLALETKAQSKMTQCPDHTASLFTVDHMDGTTHDLKRVREAEIVGYYHGEANGSLL